MIEETAGEPPTGGGASPGISENLAGSKRARDGREKAEEPDESSVFLGMKSNVYAKKRLLVKLLGRKVGYTSLYNRVKQLWALTGDFQAVDLDNGYFSFRFEKKVDYDHVLLDGPWLIADHYLLVRRWVPGFRSEEATIDSVAAWIRLPGLPLSFSDSDVLRRIGDEIDADWEVSWLWSTLMRVLSSNVLVCIALPPNYRSDPPDEKLNSALLLSRRTYPPRGFVEFLWIAYYESSHYQPADIIWLGLAGINNEKKTTKWKQQLTMALGPDNALGYGGIGARGKA
ncbi:hypothetical protein ZIOFF_051737 [Zingiber officinale]|uniref:DUF4283 domain-containing protein n=1 Tax=Zingiber officinale TaxID=94328 RepID=A0A8J5KHL5_ZINOF|nr:hypothetical protein ZIOFF_051737 [Zingiber officinale]